MGSEIPDSFGWVGSTIDNKYRVLSVVGEGGFGIVYRALHLGLQEPVAIKCLKVSDSLHSEEREQFEKSFQEEARILHRLSRSHAGIVQALDIGATEAPNGRWSPYIVLEWLDGISLEQEFANRRRSSSPPMGYREAIDFISPVLSALAVAHEQGVAHRDIKPANIFIAQVGGRSTLKVLDFGIAKVMSESVSISRALQETGVSFKAFTPLYGAPEQFDLRYGATGPWTDVFALALVVVELMTAKPALEGKDTIQLMVAASNPNYRPTPLNRGIAVPAGIESVFLRALSVNARDRYLSAADFLRELRQACPESPVASFSNFQVQSQRSSRQNTAPLQLDRQRENPSLPISSMPTVQASNPFARASSSAHTLSSDQTQPNQSQIQPALAFGTGPTTATSVPTPAKSSGKTATIIVVTVAVTVMIGVGLVVVAVIALVMLSDSDSPSTASDPQPLLKPSQIARQTTQQRKTPDGTFWVDGFGFWQDGKDVGGTSWAMARQRCQTSGQDLCSEEQWSIACAVDPNVANTESWTVSSAGSGLWIVRGGGNCQTKTEAESDHTTQSRIGLCCERRPSIATNLINSAALFGEAQTYLRMIEESSNIRPGDQIPPLLAPESEVYGTRRNRDDARKAIRSDASQYSKMELRLLRCEASIGSGAGFFECDSVMTRMKPNSFSEVSAFRQRFEYGPPEQKYGVWGRPVSTPRR